MKRILTAFACLLCFFPVLSAAEADAFPNASVTPASLPASAGFTAHERIPVPKSFKWSLAPLAASQVLDAASSYGMRELNPALAGTDGRFGGRAVALKLGVTGAIVGFEYLVVKIHPGSARFFIRINWSGAALTTGFAAHNFAIR
jgi:hypothetical protein